MKLFESRTQRGIRILEAHKAKLIVRPVEATWLGECLDYCQEFFDPKSRYHIMLEGQIKTKHMPRDGTKKEADRVYNLVVKDSEDIISSMITYLREVGAYKKPKRNFLQRFSNEIIVGTLGTLLPSVFGIGYYFGTQRFDKDAYKNSQTIISQESIILSLKSRIFSDSVANAATLTKEKEDSESQRVRDEQKKDTTIH